MRYLTLTDWTLMAVTGPQAQSFLQGQVTCDLRDLPPDHSRLGAHCNPKGRMLFSFRALAESEERVLLRVATSVMADIRASLGKYIQFSKAELSDESDRYHLRGIEGEGARAALAAQWIDPAPTPGDWVTHDGQLILTLAVDRFECWLTAEGAERLDRALGAPEPGSDHWRLRDIEAGLGEVLPRTRALFTPQSLNFPQVGAVSFQKGCYTGQEVVARLHYKGKLKQHMRRLAVNTDDAGSLEPGQPVTDGAGKKVGEVVLAAARPEEAASAECLAVLNDKALEGELMLAETFPARPLTLPYTIE